MLAPLTNPPRFISPDQHSQLTSSTPRSFTEMRPVLRWHDEEVDISLAPLSPTWDAWAGSERVRGILWVTEQAVSFLPSPLGPSSGFTFPYTALTLHALTPASTSSPAHLYCQVDESDAPPSFPIRSPKAEPHVVAVNGNGNGDTARPDGLIAENEDEEDEVEGEGEDEFTPIRELRIYLPEAKRSSPHNHQPAIGLVSTNPAGPYLHPHGQTVSGLKYILVQPLFTALSDCSSLHASLLPTGEPSGFFGFGDGPDGPDDDAFNDADEGDHAGDGDGDGEGGGGGGGRVRSDFMSGGGPNARFRPY